MSQDLAEEKKHLKTVLEKVSHAKNTLETSLTGMGESNLKRLQELRQEGEHGVDFELLLQSLHEQNESFNLKDKFQRLEELESLSKEPYFARIDLKDNKKGAASLPYYIGKFGYSEKEPVITDWRAKIASVYYRYRYPQKEVMYETPAGVEKKDLTLKRTYEIEDSELIKFYNNDIQLDENEIIVGKIKSRTGGVLEDIVETIQVSQMDIIEADPRQVCIVQGCVGSGKSTVAIHKLAHIFFNYPKLIRSNKSILVAKNQILVGYLSTLFPKLGIFDINFKTLRELIINIIFREELPIKVDLDVNQDTSNFDLSEVKKLLDKISKVHEKYKNSIDEVFSDKEFESFGGFKYVETATPFENVSEAVSDIEEELEMQKEGLKEASPNSVRAYLFKENIKSLRKLIKKLSTLRNDIKQKTLPGLVKELKLNTGEKMGYQETLIYLLAYSEMVGISKYPKFEYCVVDEGQDFSVLEYTFLNKLVLRGRFAIFGDLNQSVESDGIGDWADIAKVITDAKNAKTFELDTNYRSTKPIIDLARNILDPYTSNYLPKSINRKGEDPVQKTFVNNKDLMEEFKDLISEDVKDLNKSVGIICWSSELLQETKGVVEDLNLPSEHLLYLDTKTKIRYLPKGVYLMKSEDCKGLEFSKVYILGLNLKNVETAETARKAFVSVTRAMNDLTIFGLK